MAVVKADAYGHGAVMAAEALQKAGADWFAVSNLDEALQLRRAGLTLPILILSYTPPEEVRTLADNRITQTVVSAEHARELSRAAVREKVTLEVHLKLDTGMSRVGFFCQDSGLAANPDTVEEIAAVCALDGLHADGIFTHFAVADEPDGEAFTRQQYACFMNMIEALGQRGIVFSLRHCCNSAATLRFPDMHLDMVRPGIVLYGMYPDAWMRDLLPLSPVMSLRTRISQVKRLPCEATVSYGRQYRAPLCADIATVPIGYADGYTRRVTGRAHMLVNGKVAPVRGRICMDQCMLDVTDIADVRVGTVATAFGADHNAVLPIETYAAWSDTINYEVVCAIGKRVPRLFLRQGQPVFIQDDLL